MHNDNDTNVNGAVVQFSLVQDGICVLRKAHM